MEYFVINNEKQLRFEIHEGDEVAYTEYRFYRKSLALMHTLVPESMSNKGVGSALAAYAFQYAKDVNRPVMVFCPFISSYVKRHPEVRVQLDKEFHQGYSKNSHN